MKKTLLALMLVSSLFVISCGADATKPTDAYKSQKTEISSGTKTTNNINITATSQTVDVSTFALPGEKVTEIVEATVDNAVVKTPASTKNTDGGIYQFTTTGTGNVTSVTYKYTKTLIAPIVTRTTTVQASSGTVDMTSEQLFKYEPNVISVKNSYGSDIPFSYNGGNKITLYSSINASVTVEYQYMDVNLISEKPTKEGAIEATTQITLTQNDAGKTYVCVVNPNSSTAEYFYGIVPVGGIITFSSTTGTTV